MRAAALLIALLSLFASVGVAQDKVTLVPRRLLLDVVPASGSSFTAADALLIARSLDEKIQEADPSLVVLEAEGPSDGTSDEAMQSRADTAGADCWALVSVEGDWASAHVKVRVVDPLAHATVADLAVSRTTWVSAGGLSQEAWPDVVPAIAGKFPMREQAGAGGEATALAKLTIHARPGTVVTGMGKAPLRIEADGTGSRELPPNREYVLRATVPGYDPVNQRVFLSGNRSIELKQERSVGRTLELSLTDGRAPGIDVSVQYPDPSVFVRLGITTYALGFDLSQTQLFLSEPLTIFALQGGMYVVPEDWFFRAYVGLGAFVRIVHASGWPVMADTLSPLGLRLVVGIEVPASTRGHAYLEYTPTLYYTTVPTAFQAALGTGDTPGWWFGSSYAATIFSFRIGYRWPL